MKSRLSSVSALLLFVLALSALHWDVSLAANFRLEFSLPLEQVFPYVLDLLPKISTAASWLGLVS